MSNEILRLPRVKIKAGFSKADQTPGESGGLAGI